MIQSNLPFGLSGIGCGLLFILLSIPLWQGRVKPNPWYGFRLPQSFKSEENWYRINRFGAGRLILWSLPMILCGIVFLFLSHPLDPIVGMAPTLVCALVPTIESVIFARRL
jgi:hypothetical protein